MGIPIMNHNGEVKLPGQGDLLPKPLYLHFTRGKISEKVETDLSIGPHLFIPAKLS